MRRDEFEGSSGKKKSNEDWIGVLAQALAVISNQSSKELEKQNAKKIINDCLVYLEPTLEEKKTRRDYIQQIKEWMSKN
jgi:hypothetical protein